MPLKRLLRISRPRFWMYTIGPFAIGTLAGSSSEADLYSPLVLMFGLFFLFPANLLIYGVNDIFDYQTDRRNPKKREYEALVRPNEHKDLWIRIGAVCIPFAALLAFCPARAWLSMILFLFFSICYSVPPLRAKDKPVVDSIFNVLYVFPGIFAYALVTEAEINIFAFLAAWAWTMAMHAFSAVPDIEADENSRTQTVATKLGFYNTIYFCAALYLLSALLSVPVLTWLSFVLGPIYVGMMILSQRTEDDEELMRIYRWFPVLNTLSGMAIFLYVLSEKDWFKYFGG